MWNRIQTLQVLKGLVPLVNVNGIANRKMTWCEAAWQARHDQKFGKSSETMIKWQSHRKEVLDLFETEKEYILGNIWHHPTYLGSNGKRQMYWCFDYDHDDNPVLVPNPFPHRVEDDIKQEILWVPEIMNPDIPLWVGDKMRGKEWVWWRDVTDIRRIGLDHVHILSRKTQPCSFDSCLCGSK